MNPKIVAICLFFFALGLGVGSYVLHPKAPVGDASLTPEIRQKLQALADVDLEEYYRLKTAEEKYAKADEILGKIMTIFLADLGLHISKGTLSASQEKFVPPPAATVSNVPVKAVPAPIPAMKSEEPKSATLQAWQKTEAKLLRVRDERSVQDMLEKVRIDNFDEALKSTAKFSNRGDSLNFLNGRFSGNAQVTKADGQHTWEVDFVLSAAMGSNNLNGKYVLKLSENGKEFLNSSGSGGIREIREFSNGSQALTLQSGQDLYMQIYYLKELDQLAGNVYRRDSEDKPFASIGTVVLRRN